MNRKEISKFDAVIKAYGRKIAGNKEASYKLLKDIGVLTEKGYVRKPYRGLFKLRGGSEDQYNPDTLFYRQNNQ